MILVILGLLYLVKGHFFENFQTYSNNTRIITKYNNNLK